MPLLASATFGALFMAGDWMLRIYHAGGRLWHAVSWASRASFGVFLSHVLVLNVLEQGGLLAAFGLTAPTLLRTVVVNHGDLCLGVSTHGAARPAAADLLLTGRRPIPRETLPAARAAEGVVAERRAWAVRVDRGGS